MEPLTPGTAAALKGATDAAARRWYLALAVLLIAILLVYQLRPILSPFVVGGLIAYLGDPLADRLQSMGCSRTVAAALVFFSIGVLLLASLLVIVPLLAQQLDTLVKKLPALYAWFAGEAVPWLQHKLDLPQEQLPVKEGGSQALHGLHTDAVAKCRGLEHCALAGIADGVGVCQVLGGDLQRGLLGEKSLPRRV